MKDAIRILVVDDEVGIRDLLSYELSSCDYHVSTASNGADAVEKVKNEKFHIVISDVNMPKMGGLEMLEAIKKIDPDIEVIVSTAYGTIETAVNAMKKGAYDFVQKPFNPQEVLALIEKALEKNELKTILAVYESSKAVFSSIKIDALLPLMARLSLQILKADDASIMLVGPEGNLVVAAVVGFDDDGRKQARLALGERVAGRVAQGGGPVIINGPLEKDPRFSDVSSLRNIRSAVIFPLLTEGKTLGVLNANRTVREEPFSTSDLRHAAIFGSQIAQAIHNAKLYQELEEKIRQIQDMQLQLVQSEKLAAIGQLAAGVAHEINNPLAGIMGFAEILLQGQGLSSEQREDLETILHQSRRCRAIVQNLLQFSRRRIPRKERVELSRVLDPTLQLVRFDFFAAKIALEVDVEKNLPAVFVDPAQLEQVFLNIITNARQAMRGREAGLLKISVARAADRVVMSFEDNGPGIAPENISKLFDPFFTTKPDGEGTGLGLSISYGIIQQHQGTIRAENRAEGGGRFIVDLPGCP